MTSELAWTHVSPTVPGWRHVWLNNPPLHLLIHAHVNEGRIRITHVIVTGQSLTATQFISVPLGRIAKVIALTPPTGEPAVPSTPAEHDELSEALATIAALTQRLTESDELAVGCGRVSRPLYHLRHRSFPVQPYRGYLCQPDNQRIIYTHIYLA